ncbi:pentatricopeptide repeat-containing protein At1g02060, chloroplastic [Andrographis paniculata]|uniref:pentatricopeptide repeat-containing protein At1g02060, chloroplastic n=1 Tax=Andrographis paniculata TaxID=175694 RepID=UPI0021E83B10|nr:pentatricopeptide repeat-containing protein At1g02060, chloroplastic [Andrographis paniculata]
MAPAISSPLRNTKLPPNFRLPTKLSHVFSNPPAATATAAVATTEEDVDSANQKSKKSQKAQAMARLINAQPWSSQLEARLSFQTPISQTTFFQTLRRIKTPLKALRFFNWTRDSGFIHNHHSYFMMLEILGKARNLNTARNFLLSIPKKSDFTVPLTDKFFNTLIRSYGDAGLFQESIKVFKAMKSMGISPSVVTFNSLFTILFRRGKVGMVYEVFDEMLRTFGVKPDLYTFSILIRGFCKNSMVDEAFRMFKEMESFDCRPDVVTYSTIVDGLCQAGKANIARNVVAAMRNKGDALRPNVVTYTTLIRGYCERREIDEAIDVFSEMIGDGIKPNGITINTIIKGLCETRRLDTMKEILNECEGGFVPDACTFNTVMNAHCDNGNLDEALKGFKKMKELSVKRDSATYSVLIRALCKNGRFDEAEQLLDELFEEEILLRDGDRTPLVAAYNPIFEYLCANRKTKKAERVFRQLMKRGTQDPNAFETLISGHCREGTFERGYNLLVLMLRRYFTPHVTIYESLIAGLLQMHEAGLAFDALLKMVKSSYRPRTSLFHRVLMSLIEKGSPRESMGLMMLLLEKEIRPNMNLSTDTVRLLFRSGLRDKAFQLVTSLYKQGYIVNMSELIPILCREGKSSEACGLVMISLANRQEIDTGIYDMVLSSLCKSHKLEEAFKLYYELLERGIRQPLTCLEQLRNALEAQGKAKEAEFVRNRILNFS